jgi:hypothetical protein
VFGLIAYGLFGIIMTLLMRVARKDAPRETTVAAVATIAAATASGS